MLPQLTHIATVIPSLTVKPIDEIHKIWEEFICEGSPKELDIKTVYTPIRDNGLGLHKVVGFWGTVKLSWFRRFPYTKSLWKALHMEEVKEAGFNAINFNLDTLQTARRRIRNPVGSEIYNNLKKCRISVLNVYPNKNLQLHQNLNMDGTIRDARLMPDGKIPLYMEISALKNAIEGKVIKLEDCI